MPRIGGVGNPAYTSYPLSQGAPRWAHSQSRPPTAHSSGRMLPREMRTDVMPGAFDASSPADESVEAAEVPTQHVLPKALPIALSLMKPTSPEITRLLARRKCPRATHSLDSHWTAIPWQRVAFGGTWDGSNCLLLHGVAYGDTPPFQLPKLRVAGSRRRSRKRMASFAGPRTRSRAP